MIIMDIAIVGGHSATKDKDKSSYDEVWGINRVGMNSRCKGLDGSILPQKWFDLHKSYNRDWLNQLNCPVYLRKKDEKVKKSEKYPRKEMIEKYGHRFGSMVAWVIAYAIEYGATKIGLYGIRMTCLHEYREQRPNVLYWIGLCEGKGIDVYRADYKLQPLLDYPYGKLTNK